jgi:hypothetical protein
MVYTPVQIRRRNSQQEIYDFNNREGGRPQQRLFSSNRRGGGKKRLYNCEIYRQIVALGCQQSNECGPLAAVE